MSDHGPRPCAIFRFVLGMPAIRPSSAAVAYGAVKDQLVSLSLEIEVREKTAGAQGGERRAACACSTEGKSRAEYILPANPTRCQVHECDASVSIAFATIEDFVLCLAAHRSLRGMEPPLST